MRDLTAGISSPAATVPLGEIQQSRSDFPGRQISFHLELTCCGLTGIAALCRVLEEAGLALQSLRTGAGGVVHCVLLDDGRSDLSRLVDGFGPWAVLDRWTTQVAF